MKSYLVALVLLLCVVSAVARPLKHHAHAGAAPSLRTAPLDVMGIELGQPLTISECPIEFVYDHDSYITGGVTLPCITRDDVKKARTPFGEGEEVFIAKSDLVSGILGINAVIVGGKIEVLKLETWGRVAQQVLYAGFVQKYGPATTTTQDSTENGLGQKFDKINATWRFSNLSVSFEGITDKLDRGMITIATNAGTAFEDAKAASYLQSQPKL